MAGFTPSSPDNASLNVTGTISVTNLPLQVTQSIPVTLHSSSINALFDPDVELDLFKRARVSAPHSLFDKIFHFNTLSNFFHVQSIGSASFTKAPLFVGTFMNVNTGSGDTIIVQSKEYMPYNPGHTFFVTWNTTLGLPKDGVIKRIGWYDSNNGVFLEHSGTNVNWVMRSSATGLLTDTRLSQSAWNIDKLDGTGKSGITLDFSRSEIIQIQVGAGGVKVGFNFSGQLVWAHKYQGANIVPTSGFFGSLLYPVRAEVTNYATTASPTSPRITYVSVVREGADQSVGQQWAVDTGNATKTITTTMQTLLSIKISGSNYGAMVEPQSLEISADSNNGVHWIMSINPTSGSNNTFTSVGTGSISQFSSDQATITNLGRIISSGYLLAQGGLRLTSNEIGKDAAPRICTDTTGSSEYLVVSARTLSATNGVTAALIFKEII